MIQLSSLRKPAITTDDFDWQKAMEDLEALSKTGKATEEEIRRLRLSYNDRDSKEFLYRLERIQNKEDTV